MKTLSVLFSLALLGLMMTGCGTKRQYFTPETLSGKVNDYYPIFNGLESKVVEAYHTSGTPTKVYFMNHDADSMMVSLDFLEDRNPNLRLSRVVMPDGTMDGPFGVETGYNITQKGGYELIFNENQMA